MKLGYLAEDSEDLKPDIDMVKVMIEDSEDSNSALCFFFSCFINYSSEANEFKDKIYMDT